MADGVDNTNKVAPIEGESLSTVQPEISNDGSKIGSLSVRGLLAIILVLDISILAVAKLPIPDVVANLAVAAISFYYGHSVGKSSR